MWKLNKLDKLIINLYHDYPIILATCVVAFGTVFVIVILSYSGYNKPSADYTKGYNDGLTEMNVTKYSVAEAVSNHNDHDMFHSNSDYLNGYIRGYNDGLLKNADKIMGTNCSR